MITIERHEEYNQSYWDAKYEDDDHGRGMVATGTHLIYVMLPEGTDFFVLAFIADRLTVGVAVIDDDNINFNWKC